jgi:NAD(P)-dependent dehydrogenase (short-subunit alcohol dehydrogenase family)
MAEFGRIDVLVNNAFKGPNFKLFSEDDLEYWRQVFEVNVFGALQLTQAVVPHMKAGGGGSIVFINTMSTRIIEPASGSYASSKGALMIAAQTLAKELGRDKIRVNSVVPGYIWGPSLAGYFKLLAKQQGTTPEAVKAEIAGRTALNHIPDSEEIADSVLFFASDLSRVVTGQALDVNGGHFFH